MNIELALRSVSIPELSRMSGVPQSAVGRAVKSGQLPTRGPNAEKLRKALEAMVSGGKGLFDYKKAIDAAIAAENLAEKQRKNGLEAGTLVTRDDLAVCHRTAGVEMRKGCEVLRRAVVASVPAKDRPRVRAALDTELERLRERVGRALTI